MNITLALLWANASWREAARVGVREVDTEHLYLGLLALGGAAARLLGSHGVTLASARERVRDAQAADLRSLGIDPDPLLLPPRQLREIGHPDLVFTPAARRIVDARHPDTYACLVELLKQADAPRRLLAADGVLPNDLVAELKEGSDDALAAETVPPTPGLLPPPAQAQRVGRFVSTPPGRLADLLADPQSLAWWAYDPDGVEVFDGGEQVRLHKRSASFTIRFHLTRRAHGTGGDAHTVTWLQEMTDGPNAGEPLRSDTFTMTAAPGGCELVHTCETRSFGALGRVIAPVTRALTGRGLTFTVTTIAYAAAETPNRG